MLIIVLIMSYYLNERTMKKYFLFIFFATTSIIVSAQTQYGVVKTRGRMVNGKLVPGEKIPSAMVSVRGRSAILSGADGSFSFTVAGNSFIVDSVRKKDYALIDTEACRQYKFPQSPFVLLMEKSEVQQAELLAKERSLRRDLQRRLQKREDEVDALNVSLEAKNRLLSEINRDREENEKLIKDLAEYYAKLDYDQLDEFQRRVSECIENGELERADSLLRSRGNMNKRIAEIHDEEAAEAKEDEAIAKRQKNNQNAKEGTKEKKEIAAADCYSFHQRFARDHQRDSAAYYLELRASLDTTNIEWQNQAGRYIDDCLANYSKALEYYQRVLRQSILQYGEQSDWTATAYNNIGAVYDSQGDYDKALDHYCKSLDIRKEVLGTEHPVVASSYNNIGVVYCSQGDYTKALEYFNKALAIIEKVLGTEHPDVADSYNNIGVVYKRQGDYAKALECYTNAKNVWEKMFGKEHPNVATSYSNIGSVYIYQENYPEALKFLTQALEIQRKMLGVEHPNVALSYINIGFLYDSLGKYSEALDYYLKALGIQQKLYGTEHPDVAMCYNNIGYVSAEMGNNPKALEYLTKALEIREKVLGPEHPSTKKSMNDVEHVKMTMIVQDSVAMQEHVFTAKVVEGDTPARQQGLSGECIVLEFADWTINDNTFLYDKCNEMLGKPKDMVIFKDGSISSHHFENAMGMRIGLKRVGKAEKKRIIKAYEKWKAKSSK